jgi:hypothetical protein
MDPKLMMLFMLIGTIITLSHVGDENLANIKRRLRCCFGSFVVNGE